MVTTGDKGVFAAADGESMSRARWTPENLEQIVREKLRELPPDKQQEVLDFVEFLLQRSAGKRAYRSLEGLWADLGVDITEEDIAEARREMWGNADPGNQR